MMNRPTSAWLDDDANSSGWDSDRAPKLRLLMLWVVFAVSLLAVAVRMAQLQTTLRDRFASGFEHLKIVEESIPARVGRILTADGAELAIDREKFDLQVHYPLIQEPANSIWLREEARRNLSAIEKKNKSLVEAESQRLLERRRELWSALSDLTGRSPEDLDRSRSVVQTRIEKIRAAVLRTRAERRERELQPSSVTAPTGWQATWNRIVKELSEPPIRSNDTEPLEEEKGYHTIALDVGEEVKDEVEANRERYPGVRIIARSHRVYPQGELASHLLGHRKPLNADEIAKRRDASADSFSNDREGDATGRGGLELKYDSFLRGVRGVRQLLKRERDGKIIEERIVRMPEHGRDLKLTFDLDIQRRAEELVDEALVNNVLLPAATDDEMNSVSPSYPSCPQSGCLVAIDISSGAIIAAATAPRFDANLLVSSDKKRWDDLMDDPRKPLFRRVTDMALAPGSVFKIVSAVAAVESGQIDPDEPIHCRGYLDRPDQYRCLAYRKSGIGHGDIDLAGALCRSCNVYFFAAARKMGPEPLVDWAGRFGIGQPTGIDLPSEEIGRLPTADRKRMGNTLGLVIGQADLLVTPMQMVRAVAAVANDGFLVTPHLAGDSGPLELKNATSYAPVFSHPEARPIEGLKRETLFHIREGMDMVVNDSHGTAYKYTRLKNIRIAGKTGTAETKNGVDHAWFAGYAPADHPRVAFVVVLEHGGSGGRTAGPVAKKFVESLVETGLIVPSGNLVGERGEYRSQTEVRVD